MFVSVCVCFLYKRLCKCSDRKAQRREEAEEWPNPVVIMRKKIFCGIPPSVLPVFKNAGLIARENCLQAT